MLKLTVLFGHPEDSQAFEEYCANQHLPLAAKIPNVERFEAGRLSSMDGSEPPSYRIAELWFESAERMAEALSSPEGEAATADLPNFATGGAPFPRSRRRRRFLRQGRGHHSPRSFLMRPVLDGCPAGVFAR